MAKKSASIMNINRDLLVAISNGQVAYVTKDESILAGLNYQPPLIEVNIAMIDPTNDQKARVRITAAGAEYLKGNGAVTEAIETIGNGYEVFTGAVLPLSKRGGGGGGAPIKYPFDKLEIGASFFVPISDKIPDPAKTLASTVSSANVRFAEVVGHKEVEVSKRGKGNKLILDDHGNKIMEKKQRDIYKYTRKFKIAAVEAGQEYGTWKAPSNGALISRVE